MLARCTSSLDLHMLIVPFWYLFRTLLVPKVALERPRRKFAPIVLVLVRFECVLLLSHTERCIVIIMYYFNRGSEIFILMYVLLIFIFCTLC